MINWSVAVDVTTKHLPCMIIYKLVNVSSIRKSVPRPVRAVHTIRQTVARQPVIAVIPPLSSHFCNRCFTLKVDLQPFVTIVCTCAPGPRLAWTRDLIESRELRDVIRAIIRRCRYCVVGKMATLHTKRKEATAIYLIISISISIKNIPTHQMQDFMILWNRRANPNGES